MWPIYSLITTLPMTLSQGSTFMLVSRFRTVINTRDLLSPLTSHFHLMFLDYRLFPYRQSLLSKEENYWRLIIQNGHLGNGTSNLRNSLQPLSPLNWLFRWNIKLIAFLHLAAYLLGEATLCHFVELFIWRDIFSRW